MVILPSFDVLLFLLHSHRGSSGILIQLLILCSYVNFQQCIKCKHGKLLVCSP